MRGIGEHLAGTPKSQQRKTLYFRRKESFTSPQKNFFVHIQIKHPLGAIFLFAVGIQSLNLVNIQLITLVNILIN